MAYVVWEAMVMANERAGEVCIKSESDIVAARKIIRDAAIAMGFGVTDVTRIVTAASELTRNVFRYAGSGVMRWRTVNTGEAVGLELTFEDHGPGIPDIKRAMEAGYTTKGGLGLGLPGAKRLMDEMEIKSEVGKGTRVTVKKWRR
jgi:serine/threonine-protein kinase RsbT